MPAGTETTLYVGGLYEKVTKPSGVVEHKHTLMAGGEAIAVKTLRSNSVNDTRYLHKDHLGSVDTITDELGTVVTRLSYDAFGKRRNAGTWAGSVGTTTWTTIAGTTHRGFTYHEHLDNVDLVHMNGRVYDPNIGRFISADPIIQAPLMSQSLNRYSYVMNNPLSLTDPSGFSWLSKLFKNKIIRTIVAVVVAYYTGVWVGGAAGGGFWGAVAGGAAGGAAGAATNTILNGGNFSQVLRSALIGGILGGITGGIGYKFSQLASGSSATESFPQVELDRPLTSMAIGSKVIAPGGVTTLEEVVVIGSTKFNVYAGGGAVANALRALRPEFESKLNRENTVDVYWDTGQIRQYGGVENTGGIVRTPLQTGKNYEIYLRSDLAPLQSADLTSVVGHEVFHVYQYSAGVSGSGIRHLMEPSAYRWEINWGSTNGVSTGYLKSRYEGYGVPSI